MSYSNYCWWFENYKKIPKDKRGFVFMERHFYESQIMREINIKEGEMYVQAKYAKIKETIL